MKDFLLHLFGCLWETEYNFDGTIRHQYCKYCYHMRYDNFQKVSKTNPSFTYFKKKL